ncbi:hypothetical protein [Planctomicrobium sp. SH664]|uniref:hypothetical protein n=1 Tax=Planctomicrobium sp. SH664 TaxID=3448125 RepID=UPI003F5C48BF
MALFQSLLQVIQALTGLFVALVAAISPWTPLLLWVAFWLFAVNWRKLYPVLMQGGLIGVILLALTTILVWSSISVPESGFHYIYGLKADNVVGKGVFVTGLLVIASFCGSVQLSGACGKLCRFDEAPVEEPAHGHSAHH